MKKSDRIRKKWRETVGLLIIVAVVGIGIAIYDIWQSIHETESADWKLWAALAIIPLAFLLLGFFMYIVMRAVRAWVEGKERQ